MRKFSYAAVILGLYAAPVLAEPSNGRLPDGRAYRTDNQGFQLVDHIAELEVTNEELRNQVLSLEDEIDRNRAALKSCNLPPAKVVDEGRAQASAAESCNAQLAILKSRAQELEAKSRVAADPIKERALQERIAYLENELTRIQQSSENVRTAQVSSLQEELRESAKREEMGLEQREQLEARLEKAETDAEKLEVAEREVNELRAQLALREKREQQLAADVESLSDKLEKLAAAQPAPGTLISSVKPTEAALNAEDRRAMMSVPPEMTEAGRERARLNSRLAAIQKQVIARKDLYDATKQKKTGVMVKLQPLVTKQGLSLDTLRARVTTIKNEEDVRAIESGLTQIEGIIAEDIQTFKRLKNL